jgi:Uma2 family endonuclease
MRSSDPDRDYNEGMATSTTGLITTEQFLALPEQYDANGDPIKAELIAGEINPVPFASSEHDLVKNQIGESLTLFLAGRPDLHVKSLIEIGFAVTDQDDLAPDVCVIARDRLRQRNERILTGAPEIAIEVVSPTDTAVRLKYKTGVYLANGSHSVWVVYPEARSVEIHTGREAREFGGDDLIEDAALPGFSQPVSGFFASL